MRPQPLAHRQRVVDHFNELAPIGTRVRYYTGTRTDPPKFGKIRHVATLLGGHTPVAWVDTHAAAVSLTHVDILLEDDDGTVGVVRVEREPEEVGA